jgi:hypothetical protein
MRIPALLICGALAACTSSVTTPDGVITEVPQTGIASTAGGDSFSTPVPVTAEGSGLTTTAPSSTGTGPALDDDTINLMQWTLEQQKIDAAKAQRDLDAAKSQLVIYQPAGSVPQERSGVNVALYAMQSTNQVGQSIYPRSAAARLTGMGGCGRYRDADAAQRAFLAAGGPQADRLGLDPDGDGFACSFDPSVYRSMKG